MNKRSLVFILIAALLLSLATTSSPAQGVRSAGIESASAVYPATLPWFIGWADQTTSDQVGSYPSIAYSPVDGLPYVSYYDAANQDLMLANPDVTGGSNCGDNGDWWCRAADGDGLDGRSLDDVGKYSSIAFWAGNDEWKLGISYYDDTHNALKFAEWSQPYIGPGSWEIVTISDSNIIGSSIGLYTALKYSSIGTPNIAYYVSNALTTDSLNYTYPVASGGDCGIGPAVGKWQCDVVDSGDSVGMYASLDLRYDDQVFIAYYDGGQGDLKYAYYGGIGPCGDGWICSTIDGASAVVGLFTAISAPQSASEPIQIAYYDKTNGKLKIASSGPISGYCDPASSWLCLDVDDVGANRSQTGVAMALDGQGYPIIAYQDASEALAPTALKVARPAAALGLFIGNCGDAPPGYLFMIWHCSTLDSAFYGQGYVNVADYTAVDVSSSGLAAIAYFEDDSYDPAHTALKIAIQRFQVFLPTVLR